MAKSLCRLLMQVNHALVANFKRGKYVFLLYSRKYNSRENLRIYSILKCKMICQQFLNVFYHDYSLSLIKAFNEKVIEYN